MIGERLEAYTFEYLINQALTTVPDDIDKREGSIIYDALAPACYMLANFYMELRNVYKDTFIDTAEGEYLDKKVAEQGLTRYSATYAIKKAYFADASNNPMVIPLGARFATVSDINPVNYYALETYKVNGVPVPGYYNLVCETAGSQGNDYYGSLISITFVQGLAQATMSTIIQPARDEETDLELRSRYLLQVNNKSFGGNLADYDTMLKEIDGVGEVQIYPVWNGGGTVKCSIIDTQYNQATTDFVNLVQSLVDPTVNTGQGLGLAPIDHKVTIVTPSTVTINISATIVLASGFTLSQVQTPVTTAISGYLLALRKQWGIPSNLNDYSMSVYIAKITSAILSASGVANVSNVKINGASVDLALTQTGATQQIPIMGTVTLT